MVINQYIFVFVWIAIVAIVYQNFNVENKIVVCERVVYRWKFLYALIAFLPVIYFAAFSQPRFDTVAYLSSYDGLQPTFENLNNALIGAEEKGWVIFRWCIKAIFGENNLFFRVILVSIHSIPVLFFLRKYSSNYLMSLYLFLACSCHFAWMMNGLRQYIAVSIILAAIPLLLKKRYLPLILIILFASTFHASALIMIPIVITAQGEPWNKKTILFILISLLLTYLFSQDAGLLDSMLTDTQYEGAVGEIIEQGDDGVNPIRVLVYCVPPILAFIGRKVISKDNDPIINLSVNMSVVTAALYLIAMTTSGVLIGRLPIYTSLFDFILLPYITSKLFSGKTAQIINILMVVLFFVYYIFESWGI